MPTFLETANDYLRIQRTAPQTARHNRWLLEHLTPVHTIAVSEIDAPRLLSALRAVEARGAHSTAHRACTLAGAVLRYALAAGVRTAPDVATGLKTILVSADKTSRAAITEPARFGALLASIATLEPSAVRDALTILPHVFTRPVELRGMRWSELDLAKGEWKIPAARMKMRKPFTKFLSGPVVAELKAIQVRSQGTEREFSEFVFPGRVSGSISENIMGLALQRLFYSPEEHTPHGFRASASTLLHEAGLEHSVIEAALAHAPRDGSTYNRAVYAEQQRDLHVRWSEMVVSLRAEAAK